MGELDLSLVRDYVKGASVSFRVRDFGVLEFRQESDKRSLFCLQSDIRSIKERSHKASPESFLQIDFKARPSILVLKNIIGFAPLSRSLVESGVLPEVVATLDLLEVKSAIESALYEEGALFSELAFLRLTYLSILEGAEAVGFILKEERDWVLSLNFLNKEQCS